MKLIPLCVGFHALTATDSAQALTTVQNLPPRVILLDVHLRNQALLLIDLLRSTSAAHIPIIGMDTQMLPTEQIAEFGLNGFLLKPFDLDEFVDSMKSYLEVTS